MLHNLTTEVLTARLTDDRRRQDAFDAFEEELVAILTGVTTSATPYTVHPAKAATELRPLDPSASPDPLRPTTLDSMIGQRTLRPLLRRLVDSAKRTGHLDHMLFVGASGTGKTTVATIVARELGTRIFSLRAPLDMGVLNQLRESAQDGDVVFVDEIHLQVSGDRRGINQACDPESFYMLLEDGVLSTATGPLPFPRVTFIGATTDIGLLPEPLTNRFPLRPQLASYTVEDMMALAKRSLTALNLSYDEAVIGLFAGASRSNPRQLNDYVKAARSLAGGQRITGALATEVIVDLSHTTLDGLTASMQTVLSFLYRHCGRQTKDGIIYTASVNTLATAAGHGRDTKAISLLVEPYLLRRGYLEVRSSGRTLTREGVERAHLLIGG